jgi:hypothetical protein
MALDRMRRDESKLVKNHKSDINHPAMTSIKKLHSYWFDRDERIGMVHPYSATCVVLMERKQPPPVRLLLGSGVQLNQNMKAS